MWRCRPKEAAYNQMESMIYHFKLIMDGIQVPAGECYSMVEGANGELGFYIRQRRLGQALSGQGAAPLFSDLLHFFASDPRRHVSDAVVTLGGLNVIAGELDR